MRFYSPLRYPGGKAFLSKELSRIISTIGLTRPTYVEPYAGGAGAALTLLFENVVSRIVINDRDKAVYAFWKAVTEHNASFIKKIYSTPVTIEEWKKQKDVYRNEGASILQRGFATFFLNRTNVSGVMNAWPIGGIEQTGTYKIDARFNKKDLIARIRKIGHYADKIEVRNDDGIDLTKEFLLQDNVFIYLDPPYFKKGAMLYMNHYKSDNHSELAEVLNANTEKHWVLTYDLTKPIRNLYPDRPRRHLNLNYRVSSARKARELVFFSDTTFV